MHDIDERRAIFRDPDGNQTVLLPGDAIRLGRHKDNDLVVNDTTASRFHATVRWDPELERPVLYDNGSANGTVVNGLEVRNCACPIGHGSMVEISDFVLQVELENCGETPAILKNAGDMVTLFTDQGPEIKGTLGVDASLREVLQRLEIERRSGTLKLVSSGSTVTVCLGKLMAVNAGALTGLDALGKVFQNPGGEYRFSRELEPTDQGLNMWFSDYMRQRKLKGNATRIHTRRELLAAAEEEDDKKKKKKKKK